MATTNETPTNFVLPDELAAPVTPTPVERPISNNGETNFTNPDFNDSSSLGVNINAPKKPEPIPQPQPEPQPTPKPEPTPPERFETPKPQPKPEPQPTPQPQPAPKPNPPEVFETPKPKSFPKPEYNTADISAAGAVANANADALRQRALNNDKKTTFTINAGAGAGYSNGVSARAAMIGGGVATTKDLGDGKKAYVSLSASGGTVNHGAVSAVRVEAGRQSGKNVIAAYGQQTNSTHPSGKENNYGAKSGTEGGVLYSRVSERGSATLNIGARSVHYENGERETQVVGGLTGTRKISQHASVSANITGSNNSVAGAVSLTGKIQKHNHTFTKLEEEKQPVVEASIQRSFALSLDSNTTFAHDKATLKPGAEKMFDDLARALLDNNVLNGKSLVDHAGQTGQKFNIAGFTDVSGSDKYNQKLSEKRANVVMSELVKRGVPASVLEAHGYGESRATISESQMKAAYDKAFTEGGEKGLRGAKLRQYALDARNELMAPDRKTEITLAGIDNVNLDAVNKHSILAKGVTESKETMYAKITDAKGNVRETVKELVHDGVARLDNLKQKSETFVQDSINKVNDTVLGLVQPKDKVAQAQHKPETPTV